MVKEQSKKRIFHFSATNVELCSADLHEKARAHSCLPGNVCNVLLGQDERRKKEEEMGGGDGKKKGWQWAGEATAGAIIHHHDNAIIRSTQISLDEFRLNRRTEEAWWWWWGGGI